ncbi:putative phosphothreonine lyase domain-containing protein [Halorubrum aidingense]|nr:putative phosphothreonine lyase domain-containg protein [Halorubrum aidingense]
MLVDRPPTEITDEGWHWLRAKDVTGFPRNARDGYFPRHGVARPAATTSADLPPAENERMADIDRLALEETYLSGKWLVERPPEETDGLWEDIVADVAAGRFWDAKVTTRAGCEAFGESDHALLVFTPNYFERGDVDRVRRRLGDAHGVTERIRYKPDVYTLSEAYEDRLGEYGASDSARYRA